VTTSADPPVPRGEHAVAAGMGRDRGGRGGRRRGRRDEHQMVPDATFTSYYGRPVVKASPWAADIPAYLFLGGLAGGSSLLAAGADLTGRPGLRRAGRIAAAAALTGSFAALVHDLGKPARFLNMLRMLKVTSPMSVGTWILSAYAPLAYAAAVDELPSALLPDPLSGLIERAGRPAGLAAALVAPAVASYTGVLLADTATPTWNAARKHLPFLFAASAAAAASGMGMLAAPVADAGPARRLALAAASAELAIGQHLETTIGLAAEPLHAGRAGQLMTAARWLTAAGAVGSLFSRRSRVAAAASGIALLGGSACLRFGIFEAGQASARDPKYTISPQRDRMRAESRPGA
jgi:formate-dependent nitrite reductase membrane component NrfD